MKAKRCQLCERWVSRTERHHLIPRARHRKKRNRKTFARQEVLERMILLCRPCHKMLHATLTEKQLEQEYNTLAAIAGHPAMRTFVKWIRKRHGDSGVAVRRTGGDDLRREPVQRRLRRKEKTRGEEG